MTVVVGQNRTDNVTSFSRVVDMERKLYELEPDAAPFTVTLTQAGKMKERANNVQYSWGNHSPEGRFGATTNTVTNVATTVPVDDGTQYNKEYLVKVPRTGEVISVTSISTNNLTVERGLGGTTATAMNNGEQLYIMGVAATEGDYSQPARTVLETQVTNYCQEFKRSVDASSIEMSSADMFTPHKWNRMVAEQGREHRKDIELAFLIGAPEERTTQSATSAGKRRLTGGLLYFLTGNNTAAGGTLTTATIRTWLRSVFRYGSGQRTIYASSVVLQALDSFFEAKLQLRPSDQTYDVTTQQWVMSAGTVNLVKHPALEGTTYSGYAIAVDYGQDYLKMRYLDGDGAPGGSLDTKLIENVQANDLRGRRDEYNSVVGLQVGQPGVHGVLTGVTGPS